MQRVAAPLINREAISSNFVSAESALAQLERVEEKDSEEEYSCLSDKKLKVKSSMIDYTVFLNQIKYGEDNFSTLHNFEIRFQDDQDDIVQDFGSGQIMLKYKMSGQLNVRRGVIYKSGHYPTTVDFVFENMGSHESIPYPVPMFELDTFDSIIEDLDITGLGAQLLVELSDVTEDIDLGVETKFEAKVYLNNKMKIVNRAESDYQYVLFLGVTEGNTIIHFKNNMNEISNKIIHLGAKELYYEPNFYAEVLDESFELY